MANSSNVGIKLWAFYFIITGIFSSLIVIKYLRGIAIDTLFQYIHLSYLVLFVLLSFMVGIGLFKLNKIARKGAMLIACIYLIGVIILLPFAIHYLISGKPALLTLLKIIVQSSIGIAVLLYFNRSSVKSFFG